MKRDKCIDTKYWKGNWKTVIQSSRISNCLHWCFTEFSGHILFRYNSYLLIEDFGSNLSPDFSCWRTSWRWFWWSHRECHIGVPSLVTLAWLHGAFHLQTTSEQSRWCLKKISYTYTVSRVTYTDEYRACIWTSLGEFRYERYESVYVTLLTV